MNYVDFTSLPPQDEAKFVIYEQRTQEASKKAIQIGAIVAAVIGVLVMIIVFSFDKPKNLMADDDIGMLGSTEDRNQQRQELKTDSTTPADTAGESGTAPDPATGPASDTPTPAGDTPAADTPAEAPATP